MTGKYSTCTGINKPWKFHQTNRNILIYQNVTNKQTSAYLSIKLTFSMNLEPILNENNKVIAKSRDWNKLFMNGYTRQIQKNKQTTERSIKLGKIQYMPKYYKQTNTYPRIKITYNKLAVEEFIYKARKDDHSAAKLPLYNKYWN